MRDLLLLRIREKGRHYTSCPCKNCVSRRHGQFKAWRARLIRRVRREVRQHLRKESSDE